jgi:hypothetical protein
MKAFPAMAVVLGFLISAGQPPGGAAQPVRNTSQWLKANSDKVATVTILILSYDRRDKSDYPDNLYLPRFIKPALAKLKDKGARKIKLNVKKGQLYFWLEGKKVATLKDIQAAFPGLRLKLIAEAIF